MLHLKNVRDVWLVLGCASIVQCPMMSRAQVDAAQVNEVRGRAAPTFSVKDKTYDNSYKIAGTVSSVDSDDIAGNTVQVLRIQVETFWSQPIVDKPEVVDIVYDPSNSAPELLPLIRIGDQFTYKVSCGFKCAKGIHVSDAEGVKYIEDDGGYGMAFEEQELLPFHLTQEDAGVRTNPDLNPFYLVVSARDQHVRLLPGQRGLLQFRNHTYAVSALVSEKKTSQRVMTDAPPSRVSYVLRRW